MADTVISPVQSNPSATTLTEIYDCPDATTFMGWMNICNRSATPTSWRVSIQKDNAADDNAQYLGYDVPIGGNAIHNIKLAMNADDRVNVYATLATLTFSLMGIETT
jgi:hypothetical protein